MKKVMMLTALLLLMLISGCSAGPNYKVEITKPIYYRENGTFEIKVTHGEEAVEDLNVTAIFSMTNMDHGTTDVELTGGAGGKYTGEVSLPMAGKYEIVFTLDKDGDKTEEVMEYEVVEPEGVASLMVSVGYR